MSPAGLWYWELDVAQGVVIWLAIHNLSVLRVLTNLQCIERTKRELLKGEVLG